MKTAKSFGGWVVASLVSAFASFPALAVKDSTPSPPATSITAITTYATYAVVQFSPEYLNELNCGGQFQYSHIVIDWKDAPDKKAMLSAALTAYSLQKNVGFGMSGCYAWKGGVPKATRVEIAD